MGPLLTYPDCIFILQSAFTMDALRSTTLVAALSGAGCSLALMLHVGRNQRSLVLIILFTGWVLSPFLAAAGASFRSRRWALPTLLITFGSVLMYGYTAFGPPMAKPASTFLMVPLISWVVLAIAFVFQRRAGR